MPNYWINTGNKIHGPFNAAQVKKLALNAELKPDHKVSTDQKRWIAAESVKGLEFTPVETPQQGVAALFAEEFGDESVAISPAMEGNGVSPISGVGPYSHSGMNLSSKPISSRTDSDLNVKFLLGGYAITCCVKLIVMPIAAMLVGAIIGFAIDGLLDSEEQAALVACTALGFCAGFAAAVVDCGNMTMSVLGTLSSELTKSFSQKQKDTFGWSFLCLVVSVVIFGATYFYWERWGGAGAGKVPIPISLQEIQEFGVPDNRFVMVNGAYAAGKPVKADNKWIFYVALVSDPDVESFEDVRLVAKVYSADGVSSDELQGIIVDSTALLTDHKEELEPAYPGIDLERCLLLWVGSKPPSTITLVGLCGLAAAFGVAAVLLNVRFIRSVQRAIATQ